MYFTPTNFTLTNFKRRIFKVLYFKLSHIKVSLFSSSGSIRGGGNRARTLFSKKPYKGSSGRSRYIKFCGCRGPIDSVQFVKSSGKGPVLVLFLIYMNVSGMHPRFCLSSQSLTMPAPWVLLRIRWSITLGDCLPCPRGE